MSSSNQTHGEVVRREGMVVSVQLAPPEARARFSVDMVTRPPVPGRASLAGERLRLVWIGQRNIPGITPGRWLRIEGFRSDHEGIPTVFNPRYELLAGAPHGTRN
ncbi:hypothetical protein [Citricoccus sp. GCM10030269]|uniref:hypothetical protein n=1 Tax=Citricoccus sp. GCM10030269 TaxID=3273388 RepID=UPI003605AFB7